MEVKCIKCCYQRGEYKVKSQASGYWCQVRDNPVKYDIAENCDRFRYVQKY
ncbi:MAG: hypothetical protein GY756_16815 [bacterium]|nr:hypothetical protein [bacterium]